MRNKSKVAIACMITSISSLMVWGACVEEANDGSCEDNQDPCSVMVDGTPAPGTCTTKTKTTTVTKNPFYCICVVN